MLLEQVHEESTNVTCIRFVALLLEVVDHVIELAAVVVVVVHVGQVISYVN